MCRSQSSSSRLKFWMSSFFRMTSRIIPFDSRLGLKGIKPVAEKDKKEKCVCENMKLVAGRNSPTANLDGWRDWGSLSCWVRCWGIFCARSRVPSPRHGNSALAECFPRKCQFSYTPKSPPRSISSILPRNWRAVRFPGLQRSFCWFVSILHNKFLWRIFLSHCIFQR